MDPCAKLSDTFGCNILFYDLLRKPFVFYMWCIKANLPGEDHCTLGSQWILHTHTTTIYWEALLLAQSMQLTCDLQIQ